MLQGGPYAVTIANFGAKLADGESGSFVYLTSPLAAMGNSADPKRIWERYFSEWKALGSCSFKDSKANF